MVLALPNCPQLFQDKFSMRISGSRSRGVSVIVYHLESLSMSLEKESSRDIRERLNQADPHSS